MKKLFAFIFAISVLFTACSSRQKEKYPPQKTDFGDGGYTWNYYNDNGQRIKYEVFKQYALTEILFEKQ